MRNREEIENILKKYKSYLNEKYNVEKIGIFGSYVRGEESEHSDIDILIELNAPVGWEFVDLKEFLEEILHKKVDLVTVGALKPQLKKKILQEVVYA